MGGQTGCLLHGGPHGVCKLLNIADNVMQHGAFTCCKEYVIVSNLTCNRQRLSVMGLMERRDNRKALRSHEPKPQWLRFVLLALGTATATL